MKKLTIAVFTTPLLMTMPLLSFAQEQEEGLLDAYMVEIALGLVTVVSIVVLLTLVVALQAMKVLAGLNKANEEAQEAVQEPGLWQKFMAAMTRSVPIEEEATVMTDHAYDGIQELDNRLPPWWLYGFYVTIVFGIGYVLYFHVFQIGNLQEAEYKQEMANAKEQVAIYLASLDNLIDESNVTLSQEQADLAVGKEAYVQNCVTCHGADGQGGVGPNLTDQYWLHGGDVKDVFKTIKYGIPQKGMIAWQNKFTPKQMQQLSSFIISLQGTNPANAKEPQGRLFEQTEEADPIQEEKAENDTKASKKQASL